jgi:phage terminase large subunit
LKEIRISDRYAPVFQAFKGELKGVHTIIVNGGRYSAKSFTCMMAAITGMVENNHRILFARQTKTSIKDSIKKEFDDQLELLNYQRYFSILNDRATSNFNRSTAIFTGFQASSGNNTANLKSLKDLSCLYVEEAEELVSEDDLEKVILSIRSLDIEPLTVLVFNAPDISHFLYIKYFEERGVKGNFNGIKDGVLYVHTDYTDVDKQYIPKHIYKNFEDSRVIYEKVEADLAGEHTKIEIKKHAFYKYTVLGGFKNSVDNPCIPHWETFIEWPEAEPDYTLFGLDFGTSPDPNALVEVSVYGNDVYVKEHIYKTEMLNSELSDGINKAIDDGRFDEMYVVADHAQKQNIKELAALGIYIIKCKKGAGSIEGGLQKLRSMNVFVHKDSLNLHYELHNYYYVHKRNLLGEIKVVPIDKDNHLIDSFRYALSIY